MPRKPKRMTGQFERWLHLPNQPMPTPLEFVQWLACMVYHLDYCAADAEQFDGQLSLVMDALAQYQIARGAEHRVGWRVNIRLNGEWSEWGTWWDGIHAEAEDSAKWSAKEMRKRGIEVDMVLVRKLTIETTEAIDNGNDTKASSKEEQATGQSET